MTDEFKGFARPTCIRCGKEKPFKKSCPGICRDCYSWEMLKIKKHNQRAHEIGKTGDLTLIQWIDILHHAQGYCQLCFAYVGTKHLTLDHICPISQQGNTTAKNVMATCQRCNKARKNRTIGEWLEIVGREA